MALLPAHLLHKCVFGVGYADTHHMCVFMTAGVCDVHTYIGYICNRMGGIRDGSFEFLHSQHQLAYGFIDSKTSNKSWNMMMYCDSDYHHDNHYYDWTLRL